MRSEQKQDTNKLVSIRKKTGIELTYLTYYNNLNLNPMSFEIQIRLADSGHAEQLEFKREINGEQLIDRISNSYSIAGKDQLLVTKTGYFIRPQDSLARVLLTDLKADKTIVNKDYKQGIENAEQRVPCIYVYNQRELKQPIQKNQPKSSEYWKQELKKKLQGLTALRAKVSIYTLNQSDYLTSPPQMIKKVDEIAKAFNTLQYSWGQLSQICTIIQQVVQLCSHQKKSMNCLTQKLEFMIKEMSKRAQKIIQSSDQLKNPAIIDDKSLRQNSGCFQNRKKQEESALCFGMKMMQFKKKSEQKLKMMKTEIKELRNKFRQCDSKAFQFGKLFNANTIQAKLDEERSKYHNIIQMLKKYELTKEAKIIYSIQNEVKLLQRLLQDKAQKAYQQLYECLAEHFRQFCEMNIQNKNYIKANYQFFLRWKKFIDECNQELTEKEQAIRLEIDKIPIRMSREPSMIVQSNESEEVSFLNFSQNAQSSISSIKNAQQTKRRIQFYKRVLFIEKYLQKLCAEQEQCRKKYSKTNSSSRQKLLKNYKVPTVQIDYEGTTDVELFRANKSLSQLQNNLQMTIQQFMITEYSMILDKVKNIVGKQSSIKLQNMQEIIRSMSQIFVKVFSEKDEQKNHQINKLTSQMQETEKTLVKLSQSINDYQNQISSYQMQVQQKDDMINTIQRSKADELARQRIKYDKIVASRKELQSKLNSQVRANEDLLNALNAQDQEITAVKESYQEIKILLGEKEVIITKMEKIIEQQKNLEKPTIPPDNLGESELKSVVLQNFGRKEDEYIKLNEEITRLNQELEMLQNQNEQLEAENAEIASELHKIIASAPSQESETQTEELNIFKKEESEGITISQQFQVGQKVIFMPFSSNLYVGVNHKDEQRTICNMSGLQQGNYLLDLQSFEQKVYNLLNECSFVVIVQVSQLRKEGNNMRVRGEIRHLLGFEQDSLNVRDYASMLKN